tara:strand:- start:700 stop:864 length:165 start_codon:yes stop_codon:yes gene_type:complete
MKNYKKNYSGLDTKFNKVSNSSSYLNLIASDIYSGLTPTSEKDYFGEDDDFLAA